MQADQLNQVTGLDVYEASIVKADGALYFMGRKGTDKLVGCVGDGGIAGEAVGEIDGEKVTIGPCDATNATAIRAALPWTAPKLIGLDTSVGLGDRLGLATPGHVRAVRGRGLKTILAQQSIRELARTNRTPQMVIDCATFGVLQEGFTDGFGSDADHLQELADIDVTLAAGFTMFTIDPGKHVDNDADTLEGDDLIAKYNAIDFDTLAITPDELKAAYAGKSFPLEGGGSIEFCEQTLLRAGVKYGNAIAHTYKMYSHLKASATDNFELEVSVDETDSPTSTAEHYFFAAELNRLGVEWVSMAPRFIGEFEKGVDYIGDLDAFRASFAEHVAVMRTLGPYKMSIHSGSDKFSIYPIVAELTNGLVHLKTAGTSYLEALRAISKIDPGLYREILDFSRGRYETDRATYHVSAEVGKVPAAADLSDEQLGGLLEDFDAREVLHVTFGSVLTEDGGEKFKTRLMAALEADEEAHYAVLESHLGKHADPFQK